MRSPALACCVALLLALGACGGDDEEDAVAAVTQVVKAGNDGGAGDIDDEAADCVARGLVDQLGIETLQDYGILDKDLQSGVALTDSEMDETDAATAAELYVECVDVEAMLAASTGEGSQLSHEARECMAMLDPATLQAILKAGFMGDTETASGLFEPVLRCAMKASS